MARCEHPRINCYGWAALDCIKQLKEYTLFAIALECIVLHRGIIKLVKRLRNGDSRRTDKRNRVSAVVISEPQRQQVKQFTIRVALFVVIAELISKCNCLLVSACTTHPMKIVHALTYHAEWEGLSRCKEPITVFLGSMHWNQHWVHVCMGISRLVTCTHLQVCKSTLGMTCAA